VSESGQTWSRTVRPYAQDKGSRVVTTINRKSKPAHMTINGGNGRKPLGLPSTFFIIDTLKTTPVKKIANPIKSLIATSMTSSDSLRGEFSPLPVMR
jgi:hypothetical protein